MQPFTTFLYKTSTLPQTLAFAFKYISYRALNEPNLSLQPAHDPVFRLTYEAFQKRVVVTLKKDSIIYKVAKQDSLFSYDTLRLSSTERFHLEILQRWFPLDSVKSREGNPISIWRKHYLDSLTALYPELHETSYYHMLLKKLTSIHYDKSSYQYFAKNISTNTYTELVSLIDNSELWHSKSFVYCDQSGMADGCSIIFEANTRNKYQVIFRLCGCDSDCPKLWLALQNILDKANVTDFLLVSEK